jgi:hypothetical protein
VLGPKAFDQDELAGGKGAVPDGKTVVVLAYLPQ